MADKKYSEFDAATTIAKTDLLLIAADAGGGNFTSKKVTQLTLKNETTSKRVLLTYSATTNTDASLGTIFDLPLTGNVILANPTNAVDGQSIKWRIKQDASIRTVTLGDKFRIPSSATTPLAWSQGGSKMDIFAVIYNATDDKFDVISMVPGY